MKKMEATDEVSSVGLEKRENGATGDKSTPLPAKNR
jgi:hypothetical protein